MSFSRAILSFGAALSVIGAGCASTPKQDESLVVPDRTGEVVMMPERGRVERPLPEPEPDDPSFAAPVVEEKPPEPPPEEKPPEPEEPVIKAPDTAAAKARVGTRSEDGIDNETPIPADGPALDAFLRAVNTAQADPRAAVNQFTDAATRTTYFYAAYYNAGAAAERAGDLPEAERQYKKSLEVRPDYGPALTNLSLLLRRIGRGGEADRLIDNALSAHEDKAGPHVAAAVRALGRGNYTLVKSEALRAVRLDERDVEARRLMARVFVKERRFETAKFALENALVLEPGNALLHLELGTVQIRLEDEDKALSAFQTAAQLRPELAEAHENAGVLLLSSGDAPAALDALRVNAKLRGKSARAQLLLGNALRANKFYQEAEAAYLRALKRDSELHEAHFNLGILYMDNELPGTDELARLKKSAAELASYGAGAKPRGRIKERVTDYEKSLKRRIKRIERRQKRDARKAAEKAGGNPDGG